MNEGDDGRLAGTKAEQTRARLLRAGVEAFGERGFHGATTRDLAAAAGMSPAAVYVHYQSKEDLLYQLSLIGHENSLAVIDANDDPALEPPSRLHRLVRAFAFHHAQDHASARIVNYELTSLTPEHYDEIRALRREINRRVRTVIDAGIASGDFAVTDSLLPSIAILSMNIDIARWYVDDRSLGADTLADAYADLAVRMVSAQGIG